LNLAGFCGTVTDANRYQFLKHDIWIIIRSGGAAGTTGACIAAFSLVTSEQIFRSGYFIWRDLPHQK